jgi:crotonobetainyl-CoA:carnitine CoA-transferase CaiB-like acyl-CoA transferase
MALLPPAGVPCAPCTAVEALFEDEHLHANALWHDTDHPQWGRIRQTGAVVRWDAHTMRLTPRAPLLGEHTEEVLREFGIAQDEIDNLLAKGVIMQRPAETA